MTSNADGSYWTTTTERNGNNTPRDQVTTLLSADNLSKTTYVDANGEEIAIGRIVPALDEQRLPPVAALGDMMWQAWNSDTRYGRMMHARRIYAIRILSPEFGLTA